MRKFGFVFLIIIFSLLWGKGAQALPKPIIFPKEGQSKVQLKQDKAFCHGWAREETGLDPKSIKSQWELLKEKAQEEEGATVGLVKGIFKGAATGAVVGVLDKNIDNKVGGDAAKGAVLGGILTHEKQKDINRDQEIRQETLQLEELEEQYETYMRAFTVCMDAKGYSVK